MSFKLDKSGQILVKCKGCDNGEVWYEDESGGGSRACGDCKDGYSEYKEPVKPPNDGFDYPEYDRQLSHYNEVKILLGVQAKYPQGGHFYNLKRIRLKELYKEHNQDDFR